MTTTIAFTRSTAESEQELRWEQITNAPYVVCYGSDDFVELPSRPGLHAYVNGMKVVGRIQIIHPGDFVRIIQNGTEETFFRFVGHCGTKAERAQGERCAFTRTVIKGMAVRCGVCDRTVSERVAQQIGSCVCGTPLCQDDQLETPAEELL